MSWNYRIVHYANGQGYGLHEVYYDDLGKPVSMGQKPATFVCHEDERPGVIQQAMLTARVDAIKRPVFEEPPEWADADWFAITSEPSSPPLTAEPTDEGEER